MTFDPDTAYSELRPYFHESVRRNEPLAHHSAFGVGGPADVWVSLEAKKELIDLVRLCAEGHSPLLIAVGPLKTSLDSDPGEVRVKSRPSRRSFAR
jgi:UDP-N-acetylmuramate dehydrogenase